MYPTAPDFGAEKSSAKIRSRFLPGRSKKSWRPIAWLYCRFLIFTQVVASGVYLAFVAVP